MSARACYSVVEVSAFIVAIRDDDQPGRLSVTNDAEAVVEELATKYPLAGRKIIYRDSMGLWDELQHDGARFTGFRFLGGKTLQQAMERALV